MKRHIFLLGLLVNGVVAIAQQNSTNNNPLNPAQNGRNDRAFWSRAGNTNQNGDNNIFGTLWNSPIYTVTNGVTRTRLSGNLPAVPALGTTVNLTGHFGIGLNGYFNTLDNAPLTMLHLEGANNTPFNNHFGGQYRTWMRVGTFMRENSDAMYVGLKPEAGTNRSDAVINWSDDSGADKLRFLFTGTLLNLPGVVNPLRSDSQNGYEFMRMHASGPVNEAGTNAGYIGVGPLFSDALTPQNRLHMNAESGLATFLQISNVAGGGRPGTGQTGTDGLKLGIQNFAAPMGNRQYGYLQWQENTPFIVQTASTGLGTSTATGERLRITSIGALNNTEGGFGGLTTPANRTRIAISADGANPITRPLSLLHLGYNTSSNFLGSPQVDGWRPWMDVGMFVSYNSDNMYVGLKNEGSDRKDAVINWGDNQPDTTNGPDRLRFIFTASNTTINNPGNPVSQSANGLETMRIVPFRDTTYYIKDTNGTIIDTVKTYGRVGIGDFTSQGVNQEPTHKLDVVGNGRFRYLPDSLYMADSTVNKYVMVDSLGVLRWGNMPTGLACWDLNGNGLQDSIEDINGDGLWNALDCQGIAGPQGPAGGNIAAQNGLTLLGGDTVELGGLLLHNTEVTLNNHDMVFNNSYGNFIVGNTNLQTPGNNVHQNIILGLNNNINIMPSVSPNGWLHRILGNNNNVYSHQNHIFGNSNEVGMANDDYAGVSDFIIGENNKAHITTSANQSYVFGKSNLVEGVNSFAFGIDNKATHEDAYCFGNKNIAPYWRAQAIGNMVYAPYYTVSVGNGSNNSGSANNIQNYVASGGNLNNIHSDPTFITKEDIPAININLVNNVAIKKYSATSALDVNGNILQNGSAVTSDATLKHNIQDYEVNADSLLNLLQPRTFEWNTIADTFMLGTQYGFIAQEFEQVIPEYVRQGADGIRHINTGALFPLLVLGYKHQSNTIDSLETVSSQLQANNDSLQSQVQDLNNRLSQLENCLSGILPFLCQMSQSAIQANTPEAQEEVRKNINVTLNNRNAIVLDQNVPNPFAEQTVINFSIPETVKKAQIHFYDGNGRFMNSVEVSERGLGSITVFGSDLSTGVYTYTLVADGQVVATKKMMKQ